MKKIAIIYLCVNGYDIFWKDFYISSEKYFLNDLDDGNKKYDKHYFLFTDKTLPIIDNNKVHIIKTENLEWTMNVLLKFANILKIKDLIEDFDYIFEFNANYIFNKNINSKDFLPNALMNETFVAVIDPNLYNKDKKTFPHEEDPKSKAYIINKNRKNTFFISCLMGGETKSFLSACEVMLKNTEQDLKYNIIVKQQDQSYWNHFLSNRPDIKVLSPAYAYPEDSKIPFEKIMILRDKSSVSLSFWFKKIKHWPLHKKILISIKYIIGFYIKKFFRLFNIYLN